MRHDERETDNRISLFEGPEPGAKLSLLVIGERGDFTCPLPDHGEIAIGRSVRCGICIEDSMLSREHALLRIRTIQRRPSGDDVDDEGGSDRGESAVEIVDLGSSNGTRIGKRRLDPHVPVPLAVGEVISLGSALMILQPAAAAPRSRQLWSHTYFEARLEDECARARETGRPFAVARLRTRAPAAAVERWLAERLRPMDVLAAYAPHEYEILLSEADPRSAQGLVMGLRSELVKLTDAGASIGLACYPARGRTPEELIANAAPARGEDGELPGPATPAIREPVPGGALDRLRPIVERLAAGTIPVLIAGETGVGKDVLASTLHALSPRASKAYVGLNCAALSESLLESELFGHERGAFTGAQQAKRGLLEVADGGTVFLDEVGEMPLAVQAKLLRVLDQGEMLRVGGLKPIRVDVRFVAATNRDLEAEVQRGTFRQDLFYRLNAVIIVVPPLRERVPEIAPLAQTFADHAARALGRPQGPFIGAEAIAQLEKNSWPGNVRELRNVIERAVLLSPTDEIRVEHLSQEKLGKVVAVRDSQRGIRLGGHGGEAPTFAPPARSSREEERSRVVAALERCHGNQTHAAKLLGVSRRTLITKMEAYGLPRPRKLRSP